jgi:hypothetical protein
MHVKGLLPNIALFLFIIPNITSKMVEKNEFIYAAAESEATSLLEAPEEQVDALQVEIVGESNETTTNNTPTEHDRMVGAGVASGVIGMLVGGPFLGLLLGFGAAYASTKTDGPVGDAARAVGDVALVAKAKAQEVDAKHNLVTKTKVAANEAWERAKQVDRKHNVLAKSKEFVVFSWCVNRNVAFALWICILIFSFSECCRQKMLEINREHRVLERSVEALGRALAYLVSQLQEKMRQDHAESDSANSWTEVTEQETAMVVEENKEESK